MFDVVVIGGGPSGAAVAADLARRGRSVALLERTSYEAPRAGETLDAETFPLLTALGAAGVLGPLLDDEVPHRAVRSAWGSEAIADRPSIHHPLGEGRHVQRHRFDAALAQWAQSHGVVVRTGVGACVAGVDAGARGERAFRVEPARGAAVVGRYLVDASGRGAPATARLGRRWLAVDRQIAFVARLRASGDLGFDLLLEAAEQGWWYSVPQADGALVVALVTDADLVARGDRAGLGARFRDALARTTHTRRRCAGAASADVPIHLARADSGVLVPDHGRGWCAVGDAAMARDPLAGNGVARALRSALEAAPRIDAELRGEAPPARPPLLSELPAYLERRASHYAMEGRWPSAPFWARRRPGAWRDVPITLDPTARLRRAADVPIASLARAEALVPPRVVASTLAAAEAPTAAHLLLSRMRERSPIGDRRLLVGLQTLVAIGALTPA